MGSPISSWQQFAQSPTTKIGLELSVICKPLGFISKVESEKKSLEKDFRKKSPVFFPASSQDC